MPHPISSAVRRARPVVPGGPTFRAGHETPAAWISYEDFLAWGDEDTRAEWVNGEIVMMSPCSSDHQRLVDFLVSVLGLFVERFELGRLISAPFQMKTGEDLPGREPDLLFVATANLRRIRPTHLDGPADLVVEVVSPESRLRDRGEKLAEYEMGGVREYWLLDPDERRADFYVLGPDGRYERRTLGPRSSRVRPRTGSRERDVYRSEVIAGFWLRDRWLFGKPMPRILDVLRELGVI